MEKINISQHFSQFQGFSGPEVIGEMNGSSIKLEKLQGEFDWQQHDDKDELLYVIKGRLLMMYHERNIWVEAGELIVIPKGVAYKIFVPNGECHTLFIEHNQHLQAKLRRCS
ncbi:cupin domain-containing protein [Brevibacillus centrosporus]|uniref:cupin domain-containing protein n=1 Tax=Brevibacillus centrosporus TaxID=54910 RepID=UPI002E21860B|nr:cupin domain-containing protein [Brevibacillus centrosporus]